MSADRIQFSEAVRFKAERGLTRAVADAARRSRTSSAEYMRRALRERVTLDGVALPRIDSDGPDDHTPAPAARIAA
ncbi:hypothetical protein [Methylobacterium haplocladii]|uniref:Uncharacterized protein n=1 Tax=Methylobacterium haplocladii TaxID=1176176 RepID=A0A512IQT8_9HYPH|nr:hypothetical protein [Methylobacterium haplocladii]GEP00036.1 hypothetical protein MHA02_24230 [Methylobacterium haplocladii]GJD85750.1 hypothetical protein HPGCJGGD_3642 [Methylobacterium haplocladii]GLS59862.1 hypothetical protein GCM10007887_25350 [Methylobacterium haplocladii]